MGEAALGFRTRECESSSAGSHSFYCTDTVTYKTSSSAQVRLLRGAHTGACGNSKALPILPPCHHSLKRKSHSASPPGPPRTSCWTFERSAVVENHASQLSTHLSHRAAMGVRTEEQQTPRARGHTLALPDLLLTCRLI